MRLWGGEGLEQADVGAMAAEDLHTSCGPGGAGRQDLSWSIFRDGRGEFSMSKLGVPGTRKLNNSNTKIFLKLFKKLKNG